MQTLTEIIAETVDTKQEQLVEKMYSLIDQMIEEKVPKLVEDKIKAIVMDVEVRINTEINGKKDFIPQLQDLLIRAIQDALK